ncbi:hypothetical protein BJX68DRAFT_113155 [Aspergillus pseudodeflectus]|uniref:Nephrocystin 3-like N-terminal domain-containing protein n=1 Tax=Aspergillus pseudodeflectus TaxID=176178 RepID=A0ABR4K824_9EURO
MNDLCSAFTAVLSCFPNVFIVIDAIDECQDDKNRADLLEAVRELRPHAGILATSRHYGAIEDAFEDDVWLEIEASATDIETYVGSEIHKRYFVLSNELADDPVPRSHVINAIMSRSRGM